MSEGAEFAEFMRRVRAGDEDAAAELVQRYRPQIERVIRINLTDPRLRTRFGVSDIFQTVFKDFFFRIATDRYEIESSADLVNLLCAAAKNRVIHHAKMNRAERRDVGRVVQSAVEDLNVVSRDATTSSVISAREVFEKCRERLSEEELHLVKLRQEDWSWEEIGREVGKTADAARMQHDRAILRVRKDLGLE